MNPAPKASPTGTVVAGPKPSAGDPSPNRTPPQKMASPVRGIAAATIGNALEWFDMSIYALLAIYIGRNFFPSDNPATGVIQAFAVFGASYLIRPLGSPALAPMPTGRASEAAWARQRRRRRTHCRLRRFRKARSVPDMSGVGAQATLDPQRGALPMSMHHEILIIGGGNAGLSVAARLRNAGRTDIV